MSETSKPTPGPWKQHIVDEIQVIDASGGAIAIMNGDYEDDAVRMEANARLIAASPTMLEALKGCIEHMEHSTPHGKDAYNAARAAIALAESRT